MTDPTTALAPPANTDPLPDLAQQILSAGDLISPGAWLLWAIEQAFGTDPFEEVTKGPQRVAQQSISW